MLKLDKLVGMPNIDKVRSKNIKHLNDVLNIGISFDRLMFLILICIVVHHIVACIWEATPFNFTLFLRVITGRYDGIDSNNWTMNTGYQEANYFELYFEVFYFKVTLIIKVGFGEPHTYNYGE